MHEAVLKAAVKALIDNDGEPSLAAADLRSVATKMFAQVTTHDGWDDDIDPATLELVKDQICKAATERIEAADLILTVASRK